MLPYVPETGIRVDEPDVTDDCTAIGAGSVNDKTALVDVVIVALAVTELPSVATAVTYVPTGTPGPVIVELTTTPLNAPTRAGVTVVEPVVRTTLSVTEAPPDVNVTGVVEDVAVAAALKVIELLSDAIDVTVAPAGTPVPLATDVVVRLEKKLTVPCAMPVGVTLHMIDVAVVGAPTAP